VTPLSIFVTILAASPFRYRVFLPSSLLLLLLLLLISRLSLFSHPVTTFVTTTEIAGLSRKLKNGAAVR
jgi:hypothetical protein